MAVVWYFHHKESVSLTVKLSEKLYKSFTVIIVVPLDTLAFYDFCQTTQQVVAVWSSRRHAHRAVWLKITISPIDVWLYNCAGLDVWLSLLCTMYGSEVELVPTNTWGGQGLLGVSIRFCSFEGAAENIWHVLVSLCICILYICCMYHNYIALACPGQSLHTCMYHSQL